jgi:hypothetical protein
MRAPLRLSAGPNWSHLSGQGWVTDWTPDKVAAAPDPLIAFSNYIEQALGVGFPTKKDLIILRRRVNELFKRYPKADYYTLCRLVAYQRSRHRRFVRVYTVLDSFRDAMAAGALPELRRDNGNGAVEERLQTILANESCPRWRARLLACPDDESRRAVIADWEHEHAA